MKKRLNRYEEAILLVLYETHPLPLLKDEIIKRIEERGLIEMTDNEFREYARKLRATKDN